MKCHTSSILYVFLNAMNYDYYESPIGILEVTCTNNCLQSVQFVQPENVKSPKKCDCITNVLTEINNYFNGELYDFSHCNFSQNTTQFTQNVWQEVIKIPKGTTVSYSMLAALCGKPRAVRAVASAVAKNPFLLLVPCHRVVPSNGGVGKFSAGADRKQWLLTFESPSKSI